MMKVQTLKKSITEAELFIQHARLCVAELRGDFTYISGTKKSGACKRASMDLTRVLADLRQNR